MFFTMLSKFKKLSNMAPPSLNRGPASMPIFAFPNIEPEHSVLHKTFLKASRVVCYSFISYLNS